MKTLEKIIQSSTTPIRQDVIWIDISDHSNPIVKAYIDGRWEELQPGGSSSPITEVTCSELKSLRDSSQLIPGMQYRITDYVTTTVQENTRSAEHAFDVIVFAIDVNNLSEEARATQHVGDAYFVNNNLKAWKIWYSIDNDTNRFAWADSTNGKGVIYRMIDEFDNDCPYDFKNIQYAISDTSTYTFTFDKSGDASIGGSVSNNIIMAYKAFGKRTLNFIYFNSRGSGSHGGFEIKGNHFDYNCHNNYCTGGYSCIFNNNKFGANCYNNTLGVGGYTCNSNTFGSDCYNNTISDCSYNTFGGGCHDISLGIRSDYNSFGADCMRNSTSSYCSYNTFGEKCSYNTFGVSCCYNSFGNYCTYNTLGENCISNTFGNNCTYNTFGNNCTSNSFGNDCQYIQFGTSSSAKSYCRYIIVEDGNKYIYLSPTGTTSYNSHFQNVKIAQGVNNTTTYKTITDANVNQTSQTIYQPANSQVISV